MVKFYWGQVRYKFLICNAENINKLLELKEKHKCNVT